MPTALNDLLQATSRVRPQIGLAKELALRGWTDYYFSVMQTVALEKAQATLADLLKQVAGGEEFTITQNGEPKAKLSPMTLQAYRKNGILVHHTGKKISSEDVANALAEE